MGGFNDQQFVSDGGSQSFGADNGVRTINSQFEQDETGNYQYAYELSDGTKVRKKTENLSKSVLKVKELFPMRKCLTYSRNGV